MENTLEQAQAAANKAQAPMYVFRATNINGHEVSWFNHNGVNATPNAVLHCVVEPQSEDTGN